MSIDVKEAIKTFTKNYLWPFWGLEQTSKESKEIKLDEHGNFVSIGPSTYTDYFVRLKNRQKIKQRGGFIHYAFSWAAIVLLIFGMEVLVHCNYIVVGILLIILTIASFAMFVFLIALHVLT